MIYEPREDSFLLEEQVKKYAKNKSVLDIGSGSGIIAKATISSGAKSVLATDVDKESIDHLRKIGLNVINSNLFDKVKGKFDLIVFNPPYLPENKKEDKASARATTGGKKGDEIILKFLKQAKQYLNKDGKIILLVSSLTPIDKIKNLLSKLSLVYTTLATKKLFFEALEVWEIKEKV